MRLTDTHRLPFPQLLFRQLLALSAMAGIVASQELLAGSTAMILLWVIALPRSRSFAATSLLVLCFCLGCAYTLWREQTPPPVPTWLSTASTPQPQGKNGHKKLVPVTISGKVITTTPLLGNRLQLVVSEVTRENVPECAVPHTNQRSRSAAEQNPTRAVTLREPYSGAIVITWRDPTVLPVPGQTIQATVRLSPVHSLANPGVLDTSNYWYNQGIYFRGWNSKGSQLTVKGEGSALSTFHQTLHQRFLAALPQNTRYTPPQHNTSGNQSAAEHPSAVPDGNTNAHRLVTPTPAAAFLPALIFGDRSYIRQDDNKLITKATLAHSLSLSGLHLGYMVAIGFAVTWVIGRIFPRLWLHVGRTQLSMILSLPFAIIYLWLGQAPISLVRAAVMLFFWIMLLFLHKPKVLFDGLIIALVCILTVSPASMFDIRLQLSALSIAVIALSLPLWQSITRTMTPAHHTESKNRLSELAQKWLRAAASLLFVSFCIQVALLPLTVNAFGTAALWFPLNLLWLPILGVFVIPLGFLGLLFSSCNLYQIAEPLLILASLPCQALLALLSHMETAGILNAPYLLRPHWLSSLGFWLLLLYLPALLFYSYQCVISRTARKKQYATHVQSDTWKFLYKRTVLLCGIGIIFCTASLLWGYYSIPAPGVTLKLLDVGQGQATLIEWRLNGNTGRALIDGGGMAQTGYNAGEKVVAPALTKNQWPHLNWVINSHPDIDHLGGLLYILEAFTVDNYVPGGGRKYTTPHEQFEQKLIAKQKMHVHSIAAGDTLSLAPSLFLEVLWPPAAALNQATLSDKDTNTLSLLLRLVWNEQPLALICNDAELPALKQLLIQQAPLTANLLILPHHGSSSSYLPAFYDAVNPTAVAVSCGFNNQWGFPSEAVKQFFTQRQIPFFVTALQGQISFHWIDSTASAHVRAMRPSPMP